MATSKVERDRLYAERFFDRYRAGDDGCRYEAAATDWWAGRRLRRESHVFSTGYWSWPKVVGFLSVAPLKELEEGVLSSNLYLL